MESIAEVTCTFKGIELLESAINLGSEKMTETKIHKYEVNIEHRTSPEKGLMLVICSIHVRDEENVYELGKIRTSCIFKVNNLNDYLQKETNQLKLPEQFVFSINSISSSTTRGIMFANFRGTHLHNAVLPIVDPKVFG